MAESAATVVVTGAAGWLGRSLVQRYVAMLEEQSIAGLLCLVHRPEDVAAVSQHVPERLVERVRIRPIDITDRSAVASIFDELNGPFDVLHTAGLIHPRLIQDLFRVNLEGTRHLMAAAGRARRFVHVSSNSPFGTNPDPADHFREHEPYNPYLAYGRSKMETELAVFEAVEDGLNAVIVRPPWFYGPFQPERQTTFFSLVRRGRFPIFGAGDQKRSMVYVENLVDGIDRARLWTGAPGRAWWIADERPYAVGEIVDTVGQALRDEGLWVSPPSIRLPMFIGNAAETADRLVQRSGRYVQALHVLGEMNKSIACDISAAQRDLDYRPRISLYDGMRRSIQWCLSRGIQL